MGCWNDSPNERCVQISTQRFCLPTFFPRSNATCRKHNTNYPIPFFSCFALTVVRKLKHNRQLSKHYSPCTLSTNEDKPQAQHRHTGEHRTKDENIIQCDWRVNMVQMYWACAHFRRMLTKQMIFPRGVGSIASMYACVTRSTRNASRFSSRPNAFVPLYHRNALPTIWRRQMRMLWANRIRISASLQYARLCFHLERRWWRTDQWNSPPSAVMHCEQFVRSFVRSSWVCHTHNRI